MSDLPSPQLLVSVRSADEARAALAGGADLIDVKEPSRGPLGAADSEVIGDVLRAVDGRVPVSAALGEFVAWRDRPVPRGLHYAKWGMAGQKVLPLGAVVQIRTSSYAHFPDRKSTRLNSSHNRESRMPSSA